MLLLFSIFVKKHFWSAGSDAILICKYERNKVDIGKMMCIKVIRDGCQHLLNIYWEIMQQVLHNQSNDNTQLLNNVKIYNKIQKTLMSA